MINQLLRFNENQKTRCLLKTRLNDYQVKWQQLFNILTPKEQRELLPEQVLAKRNIN